MPLRLDAAPEGIDKIVHLALAELIGQGALAMARGAEPAVSAPVRVYHLGASAIASGEGLDAAVPVGWITTLRDGPEVLGSLEFVDAAAKRGEVGRAPSLRFGSFTTGPLHTGLAAVLDAAGRRAGRVDALAAIVRAPAVHLFAVWIRAGARSTLTVIAPAPPPLTAGEPLDAQAALDSLAGAARSALKSTRGRN